MARKDHTETKTFQKKVESAKKKLEAEYEGFDLVHDKDIIFNEVLYKAGTPLPVEAYDFIVKVGE